MGRGLRAGPTVREGGSIVSRSFVYGILRNVYRRGRSASHAGLHTRKPGWGTLGSRCRTGPNPERSRDPAHNVAKSVSYPKGCLATPLVWLSTSDASYREVIGCTRYGEHVEANADPIISVEFIRRIRTTHARGREKIEEYGVPREHTEPVDVAETVESHRWAWRPDSPHLVLIAESHVFTTLSDMSVRYTNPIGAEHAPTNYVRLVYCLAYGEPALCPGLKGGTPQYWSIFGKLVGTSPKLSVGGPRSGRLQEKVKTLKRMLHGGVWLLDASLHGIYMPKGDRIDAAKRELTADLQRLWWSGYGQAIIEQARPERIVAIGKGLFNNMRGAFSFDDWIYQPQGARTISQLGHNSEVLGRLSHWLLKASPNGSQ